ncbi:MAG: lactate racemase domain-containing protein [Bacteroidales bacterium]|jgi:nickel-dependent lactate racemase
MIYYEKGSETTVLSSEDMEHGLYAALDKLGKRKKVIVVPPDFTRYHSQAGMLTSHVYNYYREALTDVLPALGTHAPMTEMEIRKMFTNVPSYLFRVHDWRKDVVTVGIVPGDFVGEITGNAISYSWPAQLNRLIREGKHDLILSVGQVVPHEVIGMANYNKNLFVGTGGEEGINKSHFIGAVYGMERLMGKADNPVRALLNYASENFIKKLPVVYVHTVVGKDENGELVVRGLYIGDDEEVFLKAADLSLKVNFTMLDEPLEKVVVYLDPSEFKSTWLGNKSIYRTRMAMADGGELIVLAPGLKEFGEDREIDRLIRKYGYRGKMHTIDMTEENEELRNNLSAAAHLIHGSTEDRFTVTYCPGKLSEREIRSVNFEYASPDAMMQQYHPEKLQDGFNLMPDGEKIYYISNPAVGLWAYKERFN